MKDLSLVMLSLSFSSLSLMMTSFAMETWMIYLTLPSEVISSAALPAMLSITYQLSTRCTKQSNKLYYLLCAIWAISLDLSPPVMLAFGSLTDTLFRGAPLFILGVVSTITFGLALWLSNELDSSDHRALLEDLTANQNQTTDDSAEKWLLYPEGDGAASDDENLNHL